jgi:hypothetical protein
VDREDDAVGLENMGDEIEAAAAAAAVAAALLRDPGDGCGEGLGDVVDEGRERIFILVFARFLPPKEPDSTGIFWEIDEVLPLAAEDAPPEPGLMPDLPVGEGRGANGIIGGGIAATAPAFAATIGGTTKVVEEENDADCFVDCFFGLGATGAGGTTADTGPVSPCTSITVTLIPVKTSSPMAPT